MTKTALVLGSSGGIGSAISIALQSKFKVIKIDRKVIDFNSDDSYTKLSETLKSVNPDLIVNCIGHFADNTENHHLTMNVNFGSNWSIIKHFIENETTKKVRFIIIGSSAYREGRKNYMLYSASKAALYNLWLSATEFFQKKNFSIVIINPVKTKTKMMNPMSTTYIMPEDVADLVLEKAHGDENECIDMTYKE